MQHDPITAAIEALDRGDLRSARACLEEARGAVYRLEVTLAAREHGSPPTWRNAENRTRRGERERLAEVGADEAGP